MAKHTICVDVAEKVPAPDGVPFDPSEWTFEDIIEAFSMGLITAEVSDYSATPTPTESREEAMARARERSAMG